MHSTRRNLLFLAAGLAPVAGLPAPARADSRFVERVAPDVFRHFGLISLTTPANQGDVANLGFVIGRDSVAAIDTGGSAAVGRALLAAVRRVTDKPIKYVVNTHEHPDHIFGNVAFLSEHPVFVGHHNLPRSLAERGAYYLRSYRAQLGAAAIAQVRIIPPTLLVKDRLALDLGGRRLMLIAWPPAHSDCDLTVLDQTSGTLFSGDLDFLQHVPVVDGSLGGWLKVLTALPAIPARLVLPGHGRVVAPWPRALDDERRYLQTLRSDALRMIAAGVPLQAAVHRIGASERGRWQLFDAFNARNATVAYTELEWD